MIISPRILPTRLSPSDIEKRSGVSQRVLERRARDKTDNDDAYEIENE